MQMKMEIDGRIFSLEKIGRTLGARHRATQVRLTSFSLWKRLAHAQRKTRAAFGRGFSRGVNKPNYATDNTSE